MNIFKNIANNANSTSLAAQMRRARFDLFLKLLSNIEGPVSILDVGGTQRFWKVMGFSGNEHIHVTLLNVTAANVKNESFSGVAGDARSMLEFEDNQFDVVFSNSVIEHVGDYANQRLMAEEIQRVGIRYFVQTPNYWFPLEPHFHFFGFQWLPQNIRIALLQKFDLGWLKRTPDRKVAEEIIHSIQLLNKNKFLEIFPESSLYEEKFMGLTKSFVVYKGW